MRKSFVIGGVLVALTLSVGVAGEPLKSGIAVGGRTSPFHPLNVTGASKDMKNCLV